MCENIYVSTSTELLKELIKERYSPRWGELSCGVDSQQKWWQTK